MPLVINIPEADRIRRMSAALITVKAVGKAARTQMLDFSSTVKYYFRRIPWSGKKAIQVSSALDMKLVSVGQYFVSLDWDGTSVGLEDEDVGLITSGQQAVADGHGLDSSGPKAEESENTVSLDGFFTDYFG